VTREMVMPTKRVIAMKRAMASRDNNNETMAT
jgi:hypothetical protein